LFTLDLVRAGTCLSPSNSCIYIQLLLCILFSTLSYASDRIDSPVRAASSSGKNTHALSILSSSIDSSEITELDKLTITASDRDQLMEIGQSLAIIRPQEWSGTSKSIADVIADQTGIQTRKYGATGSYQSISMRGVDGSEVLVCIDGIALNSAMGGAVDLGKINASRFGRIEVYRSFIPARFGGNGLGGVINMVTLEAASAQGADIHSSFGTYGAQNHSFTVNSTISPSLQFISRLSVTNSENDFSYLDRNKTVLGTLRDPRLDDTVRIVQNNQFNAFDLFIHPSIRLHQQRTLQVMLTVSRFKANQPAEEGRENITAYNSQKAISMHVRLENHSNRGLFFIEPGLGYTYSQPYRFATSLDQASGASHATSTAPDSYTETGSNEHTFSAPILFYFIPNEQIYFESSLTLQATDINPTHTSTGQSHGDWHSKEASAGVAIDGALNLDIIEFSASGSIKGIYNETQGGLDGYTNRTLPASNQDTITWSFHAGASFRPSDSALLIFANAGRFSNHPSLRQRFGARGAHNPNPTLRPETGIKTELGIKYNRPLFYVELVGFHNRLWNKILTIFDGNQSTSINASGALVYGVENTFSARLTNWIRLESRITLQKAINLSHANNWYGRPLPNEPRLTINEQLHIGPVRNVSFTYGIGIKTEYFRAPAASKDSRADELFHSFKIDYMPVDGLHLCVAGDRITNDFVTLQQAMFQEPGGYQWVLVPANQLRASLSYSF